MCPRESSLGPVAALANQHSGAPVSLPGGPIRVPSIVERIQRYLDSSLGLSNLQELKNTNLHSPSPLIIKGVPRTSLHIPRAFEGLNAKHSPLLTPDDNSTSCSHLCYHGPGLAL